MQLPANITGTGNFTVTVAATTVFLTLNQTVYTASPTTAISATSVSSAAAVIATPMDPVSHLFSQWPQCIQPIAAKGIALTGCGPNPQCFCSDTKFLAVMMGGILEYCPPTDGPEIQSLAKQLCPNLKDSLKPKVIGVLTTLIALALISVILRVMSRRIGRVKFWWDDYLIFLAALITIGEAITIYISTSVGLGHHFITLTPLQLVAWTKTFWVTQVLFAFSITLIKLSILCFYRRIFASRQVLIWLIITGAGVIAWFLAQFLSVMFSCRPLAYFWDKSIPNGHCIDENIAGYAITGASLLTDLVIFCIPIPPLWHLHTNTSQRLNLIGLFLVGAFVCIAGIVRIPLLIRMGVADLTWTIIDVTIWISLETKLGIVCACLPTLLPLFRSIRARLEKSRRSGSGNSSPNPHSPAGKHGSQIVVVAAGRESPADKQPARGWYSAALSQVGKGDGMRSLDEREKMAGADAV